MKGKATQVRAFSEGKSKARIEVVLDSVVPKSGEPIPNHFAVFALSATIEQRTGDLYVTKRKQGSANAASLSGQVGVANALDLTPQTTGIFGFDGGELHPLGHITPPTVSISSSTGNSVLEKETRMVLESLGQ